MSLEVVHDTVGQGGPIFALASDCEKLFEEQISRLTGEDNNADGAALLSELNHRFSTWATFLGVFAEEQLCLDRRLRHHVEIQDQVLRLLDLMQGNLAYVFEADESSDHMDVESPGPTPQASLNIENVEAVSNAIERLNRIGNLIRQSSITSQARRARKFTESFDLTSFEQFAYLSLKTLYPSASEELIEQLTNSMADTYAMFLYQKSKSHTQLVSRLQTPLKTPIQLPAVLENPSDGYCDAMEPMDIEIQASAPTQPIETAVTRKLPPVERHSIPPQSKPTTMDGLEAKTRLRKLQNPSTTGRTASILVSQVDYPRPAEGSQICEWCFNPLPRFMFEGDKWRQHVNEDNRPFVCISEKCLKVSPRFSTSRKWFEHMLTTHGPNWHREVHAPSQWICPLCYDSKAIFPSTDSLATHLASHDEGSFADSQIQSIVRQSRTRHPRPQDVCPICCLSMKLEQDSSPKPESSSEGEDARLRKSLQTLGLKSSRKRIKTETGHAELDPPSQGGSAQSSTNQKPDSTAGVGPHSSSVLTVDMIANHIAGHLRTIMLLTLRIISTDAAVEITSDQQSMSGGTDNQLSRVASSHDVLNHGFDALEKLAPDDDVALDSTSDFGSPDTIPDSAEPVDWDDLQTMDEGPLADDFLQQAVQNGAFQSHLANPEPIQDRLVLPVIGKRLVPSKLTAIDFQQCVEPWALSSIETWVRAVGGAELYLKAKMIDEALVLLFTNKVPMIKLADAEALSRHVLSLLHEHGVLVPDEEWVKYGEGHVSGVLWQLTGSGCYAPRVHDPQTDASCYSYYCTQTLEKANLDDFLSRFKRPDEWHIFYKLTQKDWERMPKEEIDRQNILHEIVSGEEGYVMQLYFFGVQCRDQFRVHQPPILEGDKIDKFVEAVFGKLQTIQDLNQNHLLAQLKYRQLKQGPWIVGFSDLFRDWIRKAQFAYTDYATAYPRAEYMMRREHDRNPILRDFLNEQCRSKYAAVISTRLGWTHYLMNPLQRLQHYILLLESVERQTPQDSKEKTNLMQAIAEIKAVTRECDANIVEMRKEVAMVDLRRRLVLRPGLSASLNLDHAGRELIMHGEVIRYSSSGFTTRRLPTRCLLFDHYLVLAEEFPTKNIWEEIKLDVSKEPIPLDLLCLESINDALDQQQHAGDSLYQFKIKHLGNQTYTLGAYSASERSNWYNLIIETKTKHAKALFLQKAEPFKPRVLSDGDFNFDAGRKSTTSVLIKGTPLSRAFQELEARPDYARAPAESVKSHINCSTGFRFSREHALAIGTDSGVTVSITNRPAWMALRILRVTQIAVLEGLSLCILITDKTLVAYSLQALFPPAMPNSEDSQAAPQKLAKDVTYFATAKMNDRMLLFYKRKELLRTSFRVIELRTSQSSKKISRSFSRGTNKAENIFHEFDDFGFSSECYSLSLFKSYIAGATAKGMELVRLDRKQFFSVPDLSPPEVANVAARIRGQRPLGMFIVNPDEFIIAYENCAVYIDKHGDISRSLILDYTGTQAAQNVAMSDKYLLLFYDDYMEVRDPENGRLRQIIPGQDICLLDYGLRGSRSDISLSPHEPEFTSRGSEGIRGTVKIAMNHPEVLGRRVILDLLLDDHQQD